jgi:hypothetical protein
VILTAGSSESDNEWLNRFRNAGPATTHPVFLARRPIHGEILCAQGKDRALDGRNEVVRRSSPAAIWASDTPCGLTCFQRYFGAVIDLSLSACRVLRMPGFGSDKQAPAS